MREAMASRDRAAIAEARRRLAREHGALTLGTPAQTSAQVQFGPTVSWHAGVEHADTAYEGADAHEWALKQTRLGLFVGYATESLAVRLASDVAVNKSIAPRKPGRVGFFMQVVVRPWVWAYAPIGIMEGGVIAGRWQETADSMPEDFPTTYLSVGAGFGVVRSLELQALYRVSTKRYWSLRMAVPLRL